MALARVSWWVGMCSPMTTAKVLTPVALSKLAARSAAQVIALLPMVDLVSGCSWYSRRRSRSRRG